MRHGPGRFVLALAALLAAAPASAQDVIDGLVPPGFAGLMQIGEVFEPDFLRRDLTVIAADLELDDGQTRIVESLVLDSEAAFIAAVEAIREKLRNEHPELTEEAMSVEIRRARHAELREELLAVRQQMSRGGAGSLRPGQGAPDEAAAARSAELWKRLTEIAGEMQRLAVDIPTGARLQSLIDAYAILAGPWRRERNALRDQFIDGVASVLVDDQVAGWPVVQRTLRRQKAADRARYSGEQVDLLLVIQEAGLPTGDPAVRELLDMYAVELDEAIVARNRQLDENRFDLVQAVAAGDEVRAATLQTREIDARVALRSVNERYVVIIATTLQTAGDTTSAVALHDAYRKKAFRRVFKPDDIEIELDKAKRRTDLDEVTRAAVVDMEREYLAELERLNRKIVELTRTQEPREQVERLQRRIARLTGRPAEREDDPVRDVMKDRRKLRRDCEDRLEELLEDFDDRRHGERSSSIVAVIAVAGGRGAFRSVTGSSGLFVGPSVSSPLPGIRKAPDKQVRGGRTAR